MLGKFVVGILAARLFYASLIRDTFRVRLDTGGAQISDLYSAISRNSASSRARRSKDNLDVVHKKPWKVFNLQKVQPLSKESKVKNQSSSSELDAQHTKIDQSHINTLTEFDNISNQQKDI